MGGDDQQFAHDRDHRHPFFHATLHKVTVIDPKGGGGKTNAAMGEGMDLAEMQQTHPVAMLEQALVHILSIARGGFQPDQNLLRLTSQLLQTRQKPGAAWRRVVKRTGLDEPFVCPSSGSTSYRTAYQCQYRLHRPGPLGLQASRRIERPLPFPLSHISHNSESTVALCSTGKPPSQGRRALIVDRQSSSCEAPLQQAS